MSLDESNNKRKSKSLQCHSLDLEKSNDSLLGTRNELWNSISQLSEINDKLKDENVHLKSSLNGEKNRVMNSVNREMEIVG